MFRQSKTKREDMEFEEYRKHNPYRIPEGYFNESPSRFVAVASGEGNAAESPVAPSGAAGHGAVWNRLSPVFGLAFCFLAVAGMGIGLLNLLTPVQDGVMDYGPVDDVIAMSSPAEVYSMVDNIENGYSGYDHEEMRDLCCEYLSGDLSAVAVTEAYCLMEEENNGIVSKTEE